MPGFVFFDDYSWARIDEREPLGASLHGLPIWV